MSPDFSMLEQNLADVIKESHIKLGYTNNSMGIFYPPASINALLGTSLSADELIPVLAAFSEFAEERLGKVSARFYPDDSRFGITVPAEGVSYIHENIPDPEFLKELIGKIHSCHSVDDVTAVFSKYSENIVCRHIGHEEFEYVIYFEDGIPDSYRYCFSFDFGHASYHRFVQADLDALLEE